MFIDLNKLYFINYTIIYFLHVYHNSIRELTVYKSKLKFNVKINNNFIRKQSFKFCFGAATCKCCFVQESSVYVASDKVW